jgi:hypothetical protein
MPDGVGVQGFLIAECLGAPPPEFFKNGGLLGLTTPYLAMDRTTRTLYARNSAGAVVTVGGASIAWAQVTGTPTTLAGYGITDAYTKAAADARYYQPGGALAVGNTLSATAISGTTGTFSAGVSGTTGTFSGALSATTGTFSGLVTVNANIKFPATQVPDADVNTLDDYEEGTWTPVIGGSGGQSGQSYSLQSGTYTKIGRRVLARFDAQLSAKGTITGNARISGFPFAPAARQTVALGYWDALNTADLTNTSRLIGFIVYEV